MDDWCAHCHEYANKIDGKLFEPAICDCKGSNGKYHYSCFDSSMMYKIRINQTSCVACKKPYIIWTRHGHSITSVMAHYKENIFRIIPGLILVFLLVWFEIIAFMRLMGENNARDFIFGSQGSIFIILLAIFMYCLEQYTWNNIFSFMCNLMVIIIALNIFYISWTNSGLIISSIITYVRFSLKNTNVNANTEPP